MPLRLGLQLGSAGAPGLALAVVEALERWEVEKPKELQVRFRGMKLVEGLVPEEGTWACDIRFLS